MRLGLLVLVAGVVLALADVALACPSCISSAWGDRSYNWAFFGLLLMPFAVAIGIGVVLACASRRRADARRWNHPAKETT